MSKQQESEVLSKMKAMAVESLDPESFEWFQKIHDILIETRGLEINKINEEGT